MELACNSVPTAGSVPGAIKIRRRAAPSRPNWPRSSRPGRCGRIAAKQSPVSFHTCEPESHRFAVNFPLIQGFTVGPQRAFAAVMKYAWLGCLLFGGLLFGGTQDSDINVNTRYKVDAVTIWGKGWKTDLVADQTDTTEQTKKLSTRLRRDLVALIGNNLNPGMLDTLADRLRKELGAREVRHRLQRSDSPNHVRVDFEVKPPRFSFDTTVTKFAYNSQTGWSGGGDAGFTVHDQSFAFGMVSDGDTMAERFAGITARYENHRLGTDKLLFRLEFESYHEQWNNHTAAAA